ncbi:hypothetical protein [Nocardia carnea]|uniref:hypothetical protein n=1 Tax=Nocardia carnea TaxID=37328 RepID=UPI0024590096|nr:hypothetical protein [Nocardia carnea]
MSLCDLAPAVGYLRSDISGVHQPWDEVRMRNLAPRLGYNLRKIIVLSENTADRIDRLLFTIARNRAEAVFVPSRVHLEGQVELIKANADVIFDADDVEARWPSVTEFLLGETRFASTWRRLVR